MERAGRLIRKLNLPPGTTDPASRACAAWALAAGEKVARHTRAIALVRGSLVVEVEDNLWQRNLLLFKPVVIQNLADVLGEPLVTDLDLRPMPRRRMPQRAETARSSTEGIEDPVLDMLYRQSRKRRMA